MDRPELEERTARFAQKAASSVAANYGASGRARTPKEFVAKIGVVNEEADESVYWLEYIRDTNLSSGPQLRTLYDEAKELRAIFAASYGTARENLDRE